MNTPPEFELVSTDAAPPAPPWSWKSWLVLLFVSFQIFIIFFRNPLDLWWREMEKYAKEEHREKWEEYQPYYRVVDRWTERYECGLGVEQGWCMFGPPLARAAPFLVTRIEFEEGEPVTIASENEREPGKLFFRVGGWRQRKLEDKIAYMYPDDLPATRDLPLWKAYVRWRVRNYQEAHPDDARKIVRVELVKKRVPFPNPFPKKPEEEDDSSDPTAPTFRTVGYFNADGSLQ